MAIGTLGSEKEEDASIVAEINITPLTDVFLVLLVIFMVTTSVMTQMEVKVQLPKSTEAQSSPDQVPGVMVTLLPDSTVRIGDKTFAAHDADGMVQMFSQLLPKTTKRIVVLEGDRDAALGSAVKVMDAAKKAGAESVAIATESEGK